MSAYDDQEAVSEPVVAAVVPGSLQDRIAQREQEIAREPELAIILPVPHFEDMLFVQYRALTYREHVAIETRSEGVKDTGEMLLRVSIDKMLKACERIVEPTANPNEYADTGYRWGSKAAVELFGRALPEKATARQAVLAIFTPPDKTLPDEEAIVDHWKDAELQRKALQSGLDRRVEEN